MAPRFIAYDPSIIKKAKRSREPKLSETVFNPNTQESLCQMPSPTQSYDTPDVQLSSLAPMAPRATVDNQSIPSKGATIAGETKAVDKTADIEPDIASQSVCKPSVLYEQTAVKYTRTNRNSDKAMYTPLYSHPNETIDQSETPMAGTEQGEVITYVKSLEFTPTNGFHSSSATSSSSLNDIESPIPDISSLSKEVPETLSGSEPPENTSQSRILQEQYTEQETYDARNKSTENIASNTNHTLNQLGDSDNSGKDHCEHNNESRLENPQTAKEDDMATREDDRPPDTDDCYPLSGQKEVSTAEYISNEPTQDGHAVQRGLKRNLIDNDELIAHSDMDTRKNPNSKRVRISLEQGICQTQILNSKDDGSAISESADFRPLRIQNGTLKCITEIGHHLAFSLEGSKINATKINGHIRYSLEFSDNLGANGSGTVANPPKRRRLLFTREENKCIVGLRRDDKLSWTQICDKYNETFPMRTREKTVLKTHYANLLSKTSTTRRNPTRNSKRKSTMYKEDESEDLEELEDTDSESFTVNDILGKSPGEYLGREAGEYFFLEWYDLSTGWEPRKNVNKGMIKEFEKDYKGFYQRAIILDSRGEAGYMEYLLRWDGCKAKDNWFPERYLSPMLIRQYEECKLK